MADKARAQCVPRSAENEPALSGEVFAGHRKRMPAPHSHPNFDRVRVGFFLHIFDIFPVFPEFLEQIKRK